MSVAVAVAVALAVLASGSGGATKTEPTAPTALIGTWDVETVEADRQDQVHWDIHPGDPRLLGRTLEISRVSASFAPEIDRCAQGSWPSLTAPWEELFTRGFSRAPMGGRSAHPKPADFGFKPPNGEAATAYLLCPGKTKADQWLVSTWIAPSSPDTLIMHRDAQVLLVLIRRAANARPRASFPCDKASTPTETAICQGFDLAGWDRSVAAAYRKAVSRNPDQGGKLRGEQQAWLKKRDACAANSRCLEDTMRDRTDDLLRQADYAP